MGQFYAGVDTLSTDATLNLADPVRALPSGNGSATLTVANTGVLSVKGKLADGTSWTISLAPDASAGYRAFSQPYNTPDNYLAGLLGFAPTEANPAAYALSNSADDLLWSKPANPKDKLFPAGFGPVGVMLSNP